MRKVNLRILVWLNTAKQNSKGKSPIYGRVTIDGRRAEFAIGYQIEQEKWNASNGTVKGMGKDAMRINMEINAFKQKVYRYFDTMEQEGITPTVEQLKNRMQGKTDENHRKVLELYKRHLDEMEKLIGHGYTKSTYFKYRKTYENLQDFIMKRYKLKDVAFKELKYSFVTNFLTYLKLDCKNNHNSANKQIQRFRKVMGIAVRDGMIDKDPFASFKISWEKTEREFLSQDELQKIEDKGFSVDRLNHIKDIFLFACYTGMAYIDISNLRASHISQGVDGELWIKGKRQKTDTTYMIPLLPQAEVILQRYADYPEAILKGKLLPVPSNQKVNAYLKEIADICGINKYLTFHMARHTFATTVTLTNGVPIESVSKMLGHTNIKTTQIYSRVVEEKISKDMSVLRSKFSIERKREAT